MEAISSEQVQIPIIKPDSGETVSCLRERISASNGRLIIAVYPTWISRDNETTESYYQVLESIKTSGIPILILSEEEDISAVEQEFNTVIENCYIIKTVSGADAMPIFGWSQFFELFESLRTKELYLCGQAINFWTDVSDSEVTDDVMELNHTLRKELDSIGAEGRIVVPVQCLGSFIKHLSNRFHYIAMHLTAAIYPAYFVDLSDRTSRSIPAQLSNLRLLNA